MNTTDPHHLNASPTMMDDMTFTFARAASSNGPKSLADDTHASCFTPPNKMKPLDPTFAIGSTVRIIRSHDVASRAIIATICDNTVSLVRDDLAPVPLGRVGDKTFKDFIVAPLFIGVGRSIEECESSADQLVGLLPFEVDRNGHFNKITKSTSDKLLEQAELHKSHGDVLLRLNDYTCATSYYEAALSLISSRSNVTIGATCIIRRNGDAVIAEIDCIDSDQYDVTFPCESGEEEEATVPKNDILLSVCCEDRAYLQPRCLLNLSRCLVKLAEYDTTRGDVGCVGQSTRASRQEKYRSAAVLGCSITITLCEHLKESSRDISLLDSLIGKAHLIRSRAFIYRNMLRNAMVDAKKLILRNPNDKEALKLISEIKAKKAHIKNLDKKISKQVCRWVEMAMTTFDGAAATEHWQEKEIETTNNAELRVPSRSSSMSSLEDTVEIAISDRQRFSFSESEDEFSISLWIFKHGSMEIGAIIAFVIAMLVITHEK